MKNKLLDLLKVHVIDQDILGLNNSSREIPLRQKTLMEEKTIYESELENLRIAISEAEKKRRDLEGEVQLETQKIQTKQNRMHEIKTNKEYHAVLKETELAKKSISTMEEDILKLMEEIEQKRKDLEVKEEEYKLKFEAISSEHAELTKELETLSSKIQNKEKEREEAMAGVEPYLLRIYTSIRKKRPAPTMVPVNGYVCHACNMNIPPQQVIELKKYSSLLTCSNCQRILYWAEEEKMNAEAK